MSLSKTRALAGKGEIGLRGSSFLGGSLGPTLRQFLGENGFFFVIFSGLGHFFTKGTR